MSFNKIIMLFIFSVASLSYAQVNPIDFEVGGNGADWTWAVFEGAANPALNIIANPVSGGMNTSATVAEMTMDASTESWGGVGCESMHGSDIGAFAVTADNSTVSMMIYQVGFASPVALKFATATSYALFETIAPNTVADAWVEVQFDMSAWIGDPNGLPDQIIFFPSYAPRTMGHTVYFDNISFSAQGTGGNEPMVPAPDPTASQANVISMFSGVYTDVGVDTWNTNWSNSAYSEIMIAGNPTKLYSNLGFNGIETITSGSIDATTAGMLYFHMDIWTPNSTAFRIKLVDFLGDGFGGGNGDTEAELTFNPTQEEWVSLHIPLADFSSSGMTALTDISQLIISSDPFGTSTVYVDNVYFSKEALSLDEFDSTQFKVFPNPTQNVWNVKASQTIYEAQVIDMLGKLVLSIESNTNELVIDGSALPNGLYFAQLKTEIGTTSIKLIKR